MTGEYQLDSYDLFSRRKNVKFQEKIEDLEKCQNRGNSNSSRNSSILKNSSRVLDRSLASVFFFSCRAKNLFQSRTLSPLSKNVKSACLCPKKMETHSSVRSMNHCCSSSKTDEKGGRDATNILISYFLQFRPPSTRLLSTEKAI